MVNRYKEEVTKLILSETQNQKIKDAMAAEYLRQADDSIIKSNSVWSRYSKYIACAACLALIVATIGFTSATNGLFSAQRKSFSLYDADDALFESNGSDFEENWYDTDDEVEEAEYDYGESEALKDNNTHETIGTDTSIQDDGYAPVESDLEDDVPKNEIIVEEAVEDKSASTTDSLRSPYAPENYNGEYFAEDYVFVPAANAVVTTRSLISADSLDMTYNDLCNVIPDLYGKVGFVKFEITDILSAEDANAIANSDDFSTEYTMYKASLIYDYLSYASASGEIYVSAYGNELTQIKGYPTFAIGDTVLALVDPEGSYVKIIDQMVYQVHRVNGVDIAYHILYENIDPGDTNMGILDMESHVYTTTSNNQAIYTAKASIKELTRYVRRNFNKRSIQTFDMTNYSVQIDNTVSDNDDNDIKVPNTENTASNHTLNADIIVFKVRNVEMQPLSAENNWTQFATYSYATASNDGTTTLKFGQNTVIFDGSVDSGKVISITIRECSQLCPFTVNGITAGESWTKAVSAIGADITPQYEETVTFSVMSDNEISYNLTFTVKNGMVDSITIN